MLALYIIAGIILFIILVLSIPIDMAVDFAAEENVKARMRVGWLFGLVWKDISGRKKKKVEKIPEKKRKIRIKPLLSVLRTKGLAGATLKLAKRMLSCLKVRQLDADFRVGLDDPADMGMMCAVLWPVLVPLSSFGPMKLRMEPAFDEPAFEVNLYGRVRLFPIQMVGPLLGFILSPTGWRTVRSVVVSWWKQKR